MMLTQFFSKWGRLAVSAAMVLGMAGQAHAGLVTGSWDPAFGPYRPGLNWAIEGQFLVPNACSAQADGVYGTASGACAGASTVSLMLRLYNASADPNNFFEVSENSQYIDFHDLALQYSLPGYEISQVRVEDGQVVGFAAGLMGAAQSPMHVGFDYPAEAVDGSAYGTWLNLMGPTLICYYCEDDSGSQVASTAGLKQFLVTYESEDKSVPKFRDDQGNPLGAELDEDGTYIGRAPVPGAVAQVPEPGALALVLMALVAAGVASRRR